MSPFKGIKKYSNSNLLSEIEKKRLEDEIEFGKM
jgi:hypothetical protein